MYENLAVRPINVKIATRNLQEIVEDIWGVPHEYEKDEDGKWIPKESEENKKNLGTS